MTPVASLKVVPGWDGYRIIAEVGQHEVLHQQHRRWHGGWRSCGGRPREPGPPARAGAALFIEELFRA